MPSGPGILAALLVCACSPQAPPPAPARPLDPACPFDLAHPTSSHDLPDVLHELSALTVVDADTIACVQDEMGILFLYDLGQRRITAASAFAGKGDYEGLARAGQDYHVLRSDGLLLRLVADGKQLRVAAEVALGLPFPEIEGVCLDATGQRLWLAPKEFGKRPKDRRDERPLFTFDLQTQKVDAAAALVIAVDDVEAAAERCGVELPVRTTPKGKERVRLELGFSDIAVRKDTGDLFLLCATDHLLLVVSPEGKVRCVARLDERLLPQPESIAFLPDGDLLIGSEGGAGNARLCRFRRQPPN